MPALYFFDAVERAKALLGREMSDRGGKGFGQLVTPFERERIR